MSVFRAGVRGVILLGLLGSLWGCGEPETPEQRMARMRRSCDQEYGDQGDSAVNQCVLRLMAKAINDGEAARQERAERNGL